MRVQKVVSVDLPLSGLPVALARTRTRVRHLVPASVARSAGMLLVFVATVATISDQSLSAKNGNFSLTVTMRDAPAGSYNIQDQVRSDGAAYVDKSDPGGTTPAVYADSGYGNIHMDLTGSVRTVCIRFDAQIQVLDASQPPPLPGCFSVIVETLAGPTGVADLSPGTSGDFAMRITWTGMGSDGQAHNYVLALAGAQGGGGIHATAAADGNSWTLTNNFLNGYYRARVRLHILTGRNSGYYSIADYDMPFSFVARRQIPNLR